MPIVFSEHSKIQIKERYISQKRVIATVQNSEEIYKSFRTRKLRQRRFGSKILRVITITEGSKISIITAYYLRKK